MRRTEFIQKWLGNPDKQYTQQFRDEMLDDLDRVIKHATSLKNLDLNSATKRYFKCFKCGYKTATDGDIPFYVCLHPTEYRTSGICGGSFSIEITEQEYNNW